MTSPQRPRSAPFESRHRFATRPLAGWGNAPVEECDVYRPERVSDLAELVTGAPQPTLVARGLGRSYGDASLNGGGAVVLSARLDRMLAFDPESGVLHCEAAVSLAEIIEHFLPRGFFFPVTPGTKFITVGGAIAADVHGKNHHTNGSMSAFLREFNLLTASGSVLRCSPEENADVFWATTGGMGLTGIVLDARLQLLPVESAYMRVCYERAPDLDGALERFNESDTEYAYTVAWIDCLARGETLGRSVLMRANHALPGELPGALRATPYAMRPGRPLLVPFTLPDFTLNNLSMGIFNNVFYAAHGDAEKVVDCDRYFYPLDRVHHWNRVYGRRGVLQYQIALPPESSRSALVQILESLTASRRGSFLAVLKTFGPASRGLLSFPIQGHTLALDLPNTGADLVAELHRLDDIVVRHGGRVYLAKDACMRPESFAAMYPQLRRFREIKSKVDPQQRFDSSLARRLGIMEPA
ncbi:MAG: FAD-binding oxidoreductase [Deltaproteobacteria bacterium]|nr:FAD-binding oxidoreductase [Deltaproteobacteria bacterium]